MKILPDNMYDAIPALISKIPANAKYVAGYVDSVSFTWSKANWDKFPNAVHVTISTRGLVPAHWGDVETGDLTPQRGYDLYVAGKIRGIYCNTGEKWPLVQAIFRSHGTPQPPYWVAAYPGGGRVLPVLNGITSVGHQYINTDPVDESVITDTFLEIVTGGSMTQPTNQDISNLIKAHDTHLLTVRDELTTTIANAVTTLAGDVTAVDEHTSAQFAAAVPQLMTAMSQAGPINVTQDEIQAALSSLNIPQGIITAFYNVLAASQKPA